MGSNAGQTGGAAEVTLFVIILVLSTEMVFALAKVPEAVTMVPFLASILPGLLFVTPNPPL
jgi:hypothetical protein